MTVFLGIDGGGSKTEFVLVDADGTVLASRRAGSAYHLEVGLDGLQSMLAEGIRATLSSAGLTPSAVTYACIGIPAYGEDSALTPRLTAIAAPLLASERYCCVNDMVCGWAGALACADGINIVAGTGSIGYGEYLGRSARAGGWGELFSDEGSAYWVAKETLSAFSRMSDGRLPRGPLFERVRAHFQLEQDLDLCAAIYGPPPLVRSELAALAPLASQAARQGDAVARGIVDGAGRELGAIVRAVHERLGVPEQVTLPVSYSGGMFGDREILLPSFQRALAVDGGRFVVNEPRLTPGAGAALYAARRAGQPLPAPAVGRLARTQARNASAANTQETR